jgi:hypothetical protein
MAASIPGVLVPPSRTELTPGITYGFIASTAATLTVKHRKISSPYAVSLSSGMTFKASGDDIDYVQLSSGTVTYAPGLEFTTPGASFLITAFNSNGDSTSGATAAPATGLWIVQAEGDTETFCLYTTDANYSLWVAPGIVAQTYYLSGDDPTGDFSTFALWVVKGTVYGLCDQNGNQLPNVNGFIVSGL